MYKWIISDWQNKDFRGVFFVWWKPGFHDSSLLIECFTSYFEVDLISTFYAKLSLICLSLFSAEFLNVISVTSHYMIRANKWIFIRAIPSYFYMVLSFFYHPFDITLLYIYIVGIINYVLYQFIVIMCRDCVLVNDKLWVNIFSGTGVLLDGTKPLLAPIFYKTCSIYLFSIWVWKLMKWD